MAAHRYDMMTPAAVGELLGMLIGKELKVRNGRSIEPGSGEKTVVATFRCDEGHVGGVMVCELSLGCALGGALSLIPPKEVKQAVDSGKVPQSLYENIYEVLNIASRIFNIPGGYHMVIDKVEINPKLLAEEVEDLMWGDGERLDLMIEVPGYGAGRVSMIGV